MPLFTSVTLPTVLHSIAQGISGLDINVTPSPACFSNNWPVLVSTHLNKNSPLFTNQHFSVLLLNQNQRLQALV